MITKVEAVNRLLAAIGEDPVTTLSAGLDDAEAAENFLDRVSHDIQAAGWHANTDEKVKIVADATGQYPVSDSWLEVDTVEEHRYIDVAVRTDINDGQRKLFDTRYDRRTFTFTQSYLYLKIVNEYDFEDLPPLLQAFIAADAAVKYQQSELSSGTIDRYLQQQRLEAWTLFQASEEDQDDCNVLTDNDHCAAVTQRNNPNWGI